MGKRKRHRLLEVVDTMNNQLSRRFVLLGVMFCSILCTDAAAQSLRERAKESAGPLELSTMALRPQKSLPDVVSESDAIVYGILRDARSRLTPDEQYIVTDFQVEPIRVLFQKGGVRSTPGPVPPLTVTDFGGELELEGKRVRWTEANVRPLTAGERVFLFLRWDEQAKAYGLISGPYGVFSVADGKVEPRSKLEEHRDESVDAFIGEVSALIASRKKRH